MFPAIRERFTEGRKDHKGLVSPLAFHRPDPEPEILWFTRVRREDGPDRPLQAGSLCYATLRRRGVAADAWRERRVGVGASLDSWLRDVE
jgi:hypothetical protein